MKKILLLSLAMLSITGMQARDKTKSKRVDYRKTSIKQGVSTIKKGQTIPLESAQFDQDSLMDKYTIQPTNSTNAEIESRRIRKKKQWSKVVIELKINTDAPIGSIINVYKQKAKSVKHGTSYGLKKLFKKYKVVE